MLNEGQSLWDFLAAGGPPVGRLRGARHEFVLGDLAGGSCLGRDLEQLRGRSVLVAAHDQLSAALALIELDGVAQRMVLCTPDLADEHFPALIRTAGADACVVDGGTSAAATVGMKTIVTASPRLQPQAAARRSSGSTEWVLLTSGTTGAPKLVLHTLASLMSALAGAARPPQPLVWSTFYDIRRYGGLQIFLRGLHAGSLVLSEAKEPVEDFLKRVAVADVTHISGTPSHWRKALMSGAAGRIAPRYVRLSGELADQAILDSLKATFPQATVAHAFASTEAGVAFEVRDGRAGFPEEWLGARGGRVELRVTHETLQIRSPGAAQRYLGDEAEPLRQPDGFVDTGDRIELREGRCYFAGRRGGVINVGGQKVYPEEVEAVINTHPRVRMSLVKARRNAITGAIVTADVVLTGESADPGQPSVPVLTRELTELCKASLAAHKVPAMIRVVPSIEVSPAGKLVRPRA
ncbi:MAG: AMP-binding protein [Proteobacteria bacterium]|nr:AMP-binding protein [Pseudomonadota bacterium]